MLLQLNPANAAPYHQIPSIGKPQRHRNTTTLTLRRFQYFRSSYSKIRHRFLHRNWSWDLHIPTLLQTNETCSSLCVFFKSQLFALWNCRCEKYGEVTVQKIGVPPNKAWAEQGHQRLQKAHEILKQKLASHVSTACSSYVFMQIFAHLHTNVFEKNEKTCVYFLYNI